MGVDDHNLREVWDYIKSQDDEFHTARMIKLENGRDALDVYPVDTSITPDKLKQRIESDLDVSLKHVESKYCVDCIRYTKR